MIDKDRNVIDKHGYVIFEKHLLDENENIPKVFRRNPIEEWSDGEDLLDLPPKVDNKKHLNNKKPSL